jgi:hypothetical protein
MSINGGPDTVESGIVLALDAGNSKSYPGSGTTWTDLSGNSNNGTLINSPTYSSTNGGNLTFNGSTQYADTAVKLFTTQQFAISLWCKVNSYTGGYCSGIVSNSLYTIFGTTAGPYQGYTNTFSAGVQSGASANAIGTVRQSNLSTSAWYHYCAVYDGSQASNSTRLLLYLNGILQTLAYDGTVPATPYNNNSNTRIGYGPGGNYPYFNGLVSNIDYYNRALSATEVIQNYTALRGRYDLL